VHDDASQVRQRLARVVRERVVPAEHGTGRPLTVAAWIAPLRRHVPLVGRPGSPIEVRFSRR
jgi:hypothetical protein